ncbi:MAG: hypothetical protein E6Q97_12645 [Desulfurellales bacterium]|nr:MAG: hypothetical protein E6Q97_12645 [Desulfurellales bacterium]
MIKRSKQNWTIGATVKVGFLALVVKAAIATPGDSLPDAYILTNLAGTQLYKFVPHNGLEKIDAEDVKELMADAQAHTERVAQAAMASAAKAAQINALFA